MNQQPTDSSMEALKEVRRLLAERDAKKRELDAIDLAISRAAGISERDDRPKKPRISRSEFRNLCAARL